MLSARVLMHKKEGGGPHNGGKSNQRKPGEGLEASKKGGRQVKIANGTLKSPGFSVRGKRGGERGCEKKKKPI